MPWFQPDRVWFDTNAIWSHISGSLRNPQSMARVPNPIRATAPAPPTTGWTWTSPTIASFVVIVLLFILANLTFYRIVTVLSREKPPPRPRGSRTHLLVVLGSGGHTTEMLDMLRRTPLPSESYTHRTYVVSSGDGFSASKAHEFEKQMEDEAGKKLGTYDIVTVRRARKIYQSLISATVTAPLCVLDCFKVLRGKHKEQKGYYGYPDLILTNGPGTGVCVVLGAIICLILGWSGPPGAGKSVQTSYANSGQMRMIYIESWARVRTLSLSGTILLPLVDRFLVQWPKAVDPGSRAEYVGPLIA